MKGFQTNFENIGAIAGSLASILTYDLPEDSWKTFNERVRAVDAARALDAATKYLHPDQLLIVVCGDKEKIEPGLKELNIGEVTSVDPSTL